MKDGVFRGGWRVFRSDTSLGGPEKVGMRRALEPTGRYVIGQGVCKGAKQFRWPFSQGFLLLVPP